MGDYMKDAASGGGKVPTPKKRDDGKDNSLYSTLKKIRSAGNASGNSGHEEPEMYHSGGKVRKTGLARVRKGETVLTKTQMKEMKRKGKKRGRKRSGKKR